MTTPAVLAVAPIETAVAAIPVNVEEGEITAQHEDNRIRSTN